MRLQCNLRALLCALGACVLAPTQGLAQEYPSKPVQIVVPGSPGGANDTLARLYISELSKRWKQPITVDNRPGAGGLLAAEVATRAPADGYTLLLHADAVMAYAFTLKTRFDAEKELIPIANVANSRQICITPADSGLRSWTSFVAFSKVNPGRLNAAFYPNSVHHMQMYRMMKLAGLEVTFVPYNGQPQAMRAILSGEIQFACVTPTGVAELAKGGKIVPLAVTSTDRARALPETPTLRESGFDFEWYQWFGFFATAGTPAPVVARITADIGAVARIASIQEKIREAGFDPETRTPKESAAMIRASALLYKKAAQDAGVQPQ